MKRVFITIFLTALILSIAVSQENKQITLNGYLSTMQSVMFDSLKGTFTNDNLIHNRLNLKGYLGEHVTFAFELRTRIFTGDMVRNNDKYSDLIGADPGLTDLSWNIVNEKSFLSAQNFILSLPRNSTGEE